MCLAFGFRFWVQVSVLDHVTETSMQQPKCIIPVT